MATTKPFKKDPIKNPPLRDAGQSLRRQLEDVFLDKLLYWLLLSGFGIALAFLEWYRWFFNLPLTPWTMTIFALCVISITVWRSWTLRHEIANLKLGLKGERATGQYLQAELLPRGYFVLHDICCDGFNVDHVVIGSGGVFAIETKTRSKSPNGKVTYDGVQVLVDGLSPDRDPVIQALASARKVQEILMEYTGIDAKPRPVVLFPGWYVERQPKGAEVWVLNEKAFISFVGNEAVRHTPEQQRVLAAGLARYVHDQDK